MMGRASPFLMGFSPLQLSVGSGALVTGVYYFDPKNYNSFKESIKTGAFVAAAVFVTYSLLDAL
tara:strand:+ start:319 stop:510 length:192 start_codon:yes stop_codon:yes gene_type:complete